MKTSVGLLLALFSGSMAVAGEHTYLEFDKSGNLIASGPFEAVIPAPAGFERAAALHSNPRFMGESLRVSKAGFFSADRFILFEVETTDSGPGTLSYSSLPTINFAGREFHTRAACMEIGPEETESNDIPVLEFMEHHGFKLVPAIYARQLLIRTEDGSGEAAILYAGQLDGCDQASDEYKANFDQQFEQFVAAVRRVNQK